MSAKIVMENSSLNYAKKGLDARVIVEGIN